MAKSRSVTLTIIRIDLHSGNGGVERLLGDWELSGYSVFNHACFTQATLLSLILHAVDVVGQIKLPTAHILDWRLCSGR